MRRKFSQLSTTQKLTFICVCISLPLWAIPAAAYAVYDAYKKGF